MPTKWFQAAWPPEQPNFCNFKKNENKNLAHHLEMFALSGNTKASSNNDWTCFSSQLVMLNKV